MRLLKPALALAAYLGVGCTVVLAQPWERGIQQRRLDIEAVRLELRTHDRYERTSLRCDGRKVGHVSALFTDADGRTGTVRLVVHNDSHCRFALHVFARAERSNYDGERETELLVVPPRNRQEFSIRVDLPHHRHNWDRRRGRRHRDLSGVSVTVTIRGQLHCRPRDARPH